MPACRPFRLFIAIPVAAAAALSVPAAGASAGILVGSGDPAHASLSLSRSTATATVPVRVSGSGFGAAEKVSVFFGTARVDVTRATRAGRFGPVTVTVPVSVTPGSRYRIWARGWTSKRSVTDWLTVPADGRNWPQFHRQASQDGYDNQENELSPGDVHLLGPKWRMSPQGFVVGSSPVVANGLVYPTPGGLSTLNPPVVALSAATGAQMWSYLAGGHEVPPAVANGLVYLSQGGNVVALDATTGDLVWRYANLHLIESGSQQTVYALNAATGRKLWSYNISSSGPSAVITSSPAVANGVVYVTAGNLYAFALK